MSGKPPVKITIFSSDSSDLDSSLYESELLESATDARFHSELLSSREPPIPSSAQLTTSYTPPQLEQFKDSQVIFNNFMSLNKQTVHIHSSSSFDPDKFIERTQGNSNFTINLYAFRTHCTTNVCKQ
jgi:hypothetical protein